MPLDLDPPPPPSHSAPSGGGARAGDASSLPAPAGWSVLGLVPRLVPKPWGGVRLSPGAGSPPIGEAWLLVPDGAEQSRVSAGTAQGRPLGDLLQHPLPVMIKLLDTSSELSLQVHREKWESWLVLAATPAARITCGLTPGTTVAQLESELRRAAADAKEPSAARTGAAPGLRSLLREFTPQAGDFLCNPAGTVHAIGGGCFLLEIQSLPDETLRLWDWGRTDSDGNTRPLHVEEALVAINPEHRPEIVPSSSSRRTVPGRGFLLELPATGESSARVRGSGWEVIVDWQESPRLELRVAPALLRAQPPSENP